MVYLDMPRLKYLLLSCTYLTFALLTMTNPAAANTSNRTLVDKPYLEHAVEKATVDQTNVLTSDDNQSAFTQIVYKLNQITIESETDNTEFAQKKIVDFNINDSAKLFIGRKKLAHSSLIYTQDYSQGIASNIYLPVFNSRLQTFSAGTAIDEQHDISEQLGIEDANNRAHGLIWEYQPIAIDGEQVSFTTSYLSGASEKSNRKGDALSFSTAASAFNKALQLRGEYAQSSFQEKQNNAPSDYKKQGDKQFAQHYLISYKPQFNANKKNKGKWNIGLEKKTIGADFKPIFNHNLAHDKDITKLYGQYEKAQWSSEASISHEQNNLDDTLNTTDDIHKLSLLSRYRHAPQKSNKVNLFTPRQEYSLEYSQSNKVQNHHWENNEANPSYNHNRYQSLRLEGRYHFPSWQWHYKTGHSWAHDKLDSNAHFRTNELELGTQFALGSHTSINSHIRSLQSQKIISNLDSTEIFYGLSVNRAIDTTRSQKMELSYQHRNTELNINEREDYQAIALTGNINQRLLKAKGLKPSIDLNLSANYKQEINTSSDIITKDYEALMQVKISWAESLALEEN